MKNILVIAAHPDDEVLGCGGTLALLHDQDRVTVIFLSDGETSNNADLSGTSLTISKERRRMAQEAASLLNIQDTMFLGLPDQQLDKIPRLDIIRALQPVFDEVQPSVIYTHSQTDLNLDHRITGEVTLVLSRPVPEATVKELYTFQIPSSEWGFSQINSGFHPNVFVDIETTLHSKIDAMKKYSSEVREFPHPRSIEMILSSCKYWGGMSGVRSAEVFELVRILKGSGESKNSGGKII